jgi:hypothetical protein
LFCGEADALWGRVLMVQPARGRASAPPAAGRTQEPSPSGAGAPRGRSADGARTAAQPRPRSRRPSSPDQVRRPSFRRRPLPPLDDGPGRSALRASPSARAAPCAAWLAAASRRPRMKNRPPGATASSRPGSAPSAATGASSSWPSIGSAASTGSPASRPGPLAPGPRAEPSGGTARSRRRPSRASTKGFHQGLPR